MSVLVPDPLYAPRKGDSRKRPLQPGDRVRVPVPLRAREMVEATFLSAGRSDEAQWVEDSRAIHGGYWRDVGWVTYDGDLFPFAWPYKDIKLARRKGRAAKC